MWTNLSILCLKIKALASLVPSLR
uniref:Uncharacterized protein n=1 Tax=Anguilla anguilla TaxID=7936 RepID=A0A0E9PTH4_ANGAN